MSTENQNKLFYVRKRGSYYRPGSEGYTEYATKAGVFTEEEAIKECEGSHGEVTMHEIDIEGHNAEIRDQINALMQNYIGGSNRLQMVRNGPFRTIEERRDMDDDLRIYM